MEVIYCYHQVLNIPLIAQFLPNPIKIHTYTVMPLPAAQPALDAMINLPCENILCAINRFPQENKGQVLVIFAVSLLVLLIFIGLAIDGSQLYLNYTRLKRAVDAAAVAAANDFRRGSTLDQMESAALEILEMHQIDTSYGSDQGLYVR